MQFVETFQDWSHLLVLERNRLQRERTDRLNSPVHHFENVATLVALLQRHGPKNNYRQKPFYELLVLIKGKISTASEHEDYDRLDRLFESFWMEFTTMAHPFLSQSARMDGRSLQEFQNEYRKRLTLANMFETTERRIAGGRFSTKVSMLKRVCNATLASTAFKSPASVPKTTKETVKELTNEEQREQSLIVELPEHLNLIFESMIHIMTHNVQLVQVDREKRQEIQHIQVTVLPKVTHAENRIQQDMATLLTVPSLSWPQEEQQDFVADLKDFLDTFLHEVKYGSHREISSSVGEALTNLQNECKYEEVEEEDQEHKLDLDSLKVAYMKHHEDKQVQQTVQLMEDYANSNIIDLHAIRDETKVFGPTTAPLYARIQELDVICTTMKQQLNQIEGRRVVAVPSSSSSYEIKYKDRAAQAMTRDRNAVTLVVLREATTCLQAHRPGIVSSLMGQEHAWREPVAQLIEKHLSSLVKHPHSHMIHYQKLRTIIQSFHDDLYKNKVTPRLKVLHQHMGEHLKAFAQMKELIQGRIRSIQAGMQSYKRFDLHVQDQEGAHRIPRSWCDRLHKGWCTYPPYSDSLSLLRVQELVYAKHLE
jgi:hypothetical protein